MPTAGNAAAARAVIELSTMSGFSFDRPPGRLVTIDASRATGFQAPPERLGKAEKRLLQDRHHQPVDDRSAGFLRFDEARLLQARRNGRTWSASTRRSDPRVLPLTSAARAAIAARDDASDPKAP